MLLVLEVLACTDGDRNNGKISRTAVAELKELVNSFD